MVGDVVGVLDRLSIEQAHLVGHDWGAAIAWMTAALVPGRVASVTALSVGHPAAFATAGWEQRERSWSCSCSSSPVSPSSG
jgi:pimeloyl-ACP methyl ester carboxylesterase